MNENAARGRPGRLLSPRPRWVGLAVFAAFVAIALARAHANLPLALGAAGAALGAGAALVAQPDRWLLVYAAAATAGIAVLGNGMSSNVGWFAVDLLGGWCVLMGGRRDGVVYWSGALVLFASQWLWASRDPGWGAWMVGTTLTLLSCLLIRHEIDLVSKLRAAQAGVAGRAS